MRYLSIAALALAATVSVANIARADEWTTRENEEDHLVAAESAREAQSAPPALGYAEAAPSRSRQVDTIFQNARPARHGDAAFLRQGGRDTSNN